MLWKWSSGVCVLVGLLLTACASLPGALPALAVHDLGRLDSALPASGRTADWTPRAIEVVPAPWLVGNGMTYRLIYAQPTRRHLFQESRWVAPPAQLVELILGRALTGGRGACRLRVDLDEFIQVFDAPADSRGVVEARAWLLAPLTEEVLARRAFHLEVPARTPDAPGGVLALREAVIQLHHELSGWLETQDQAEAPGAGSPRVRCRP